MTDSSKPTGKHLKKEAGAKVAAVLNALGDLKEKLGEKKFLRNVKKAAAKKATAPKANTPKAAGKKVTPKKAAPKKAAAKKA